jgi:hypothetical protein
LTSPAYSMLSLFAALALISPVLAAPTPAPDDESLAQSAQPPQKTSILYTYGDDPCPEAEGDEIVVCAQQPESDRYRVPKELRASLKDDAPTGEVSWATRVEGYDSINQANRPNSCSPVGSYGFTGCAALALRQWFEARRAP